MLSEEELDDLTAYFYSRDISWTNGEKEWKPDREDLRSLLTDLVSEVIGSPEPSISIESGYLLVKRSDNYLDYYVHVGSEPLNE